MTTKNPLSRMTIDIPQEDHKRLKALSAVFGKSMREIIIEWIHEKLYSTNIPNSETLDAIRQIENDENLTTCKDIDDMFKKLGM